MKYPILAVVFVLSVFGLYLGWFSQIFAAFTVGPIQSTLCLAGAITLLMLSGRDAITRRGTTSRKRGGLR